MLSSPTYYFHFLVHQPSILFVGFIHAMINANRSVVMTTGDDTLYCITTHFNPEGYRSRRILYNNFAQYIAKFPNVVLITVELARGDTPFEVTNGDNQNHVQHRSNNVLWYKENLINIGMKYLPSDAKYVAWLDADIEFTNEHWAADTIAALRTNCFVQMFDTCDSLGPNGEILKSDRSLIYNWYNEPGWTKPYGRSGGAWACTTEILKWLGGLIDWNIVGSSDWEQVHAIIGLPRKYTDQRTQDWVNLAQWYVDGSVGYVDGTIRHFFHGYPSDRGYGSFRNKIIEDNKIDPTFDIYYDDFGLIHVVAEKADKVYADLDAYFKSRNEDVAQPEDEILYAVTCIFNPKGYHSRPALYFAFEKYMKSHPNVRLYTIELAFGDEPFHVTTAGNPYHIQMRTENALWYKENLLNIAINALPPEAKKVMWVDADIEFDNKNWVRDTLKALDNTPVVQVFETYQRLGPDGFPEGKKVTGFAKRYLRGAINADNVGATGLVWAATREVLQQLGGLIDWRIIGAGDRHMALALIGRSTTDHTSDHVHVDNCLYSTWMARAEKHVQRRIGYVPGNVRHFYHGVIKNRGYATRWQILTRHGYDPVTDLHYREDGLLYLTPNKPDLAREIDAYFDTRKEDEGFIDKDVEISETQQEAAE